MNSKLSVKLILFYVYFLFNQERQGFAGRQIHRMYRRLDWQKLSLDIQNEWAFDEESGMYTYLLGNKVSRREFWEPF